MLLIGLLTLLHSEKRLLGLVLPISHASELGQVLLDGSLRMLAAVARSCSTLLASALKLDLGVAAVANVGLLEFYELLGKIIELLEIVGRVGDLVGLEAEPLYHLQDGVEIHLLLGLGVGIVVAAD